MNGWLISVHCSPKYFGMPSAEIYKVTLQEADLQKEFPKLIHEK